MLVFGKGPHEDLKYQLRPSGQAPPSPLSAPRCFGPESDAAQTVSVAPVRCGRYSDPVAEAALASTLAAASSTRESEISIHTPEVASLEYMPNALDGPSDASRPDRPAIRDRSGTGVDSRGKESRASRATSSHRPRKDPGSAPVLSGGTAIQPRSRSLGSQRGRAGRRDHSSSARKDKNQIAASPRRSESRRSSVSSYSDRVPRPEKRLLARAELDLSADRRGRKARKPEAVPGCAQLAAAAGRE